MIADHVTNKLHFYAIYDAPSQLYEKNIPPILEAIIKPLSLETTLAATK